jgi:[ribosomal protein S5]-alanine N-acetyltransferase
MMDGVNLTTDRLRLRAFRADDFVWLHRLASDPEVTRYTTWGPNDQELTRAFLDHATHSGLGPDAYLWAVTLPDGTGIGTAGLDVTSKANQRAEFGYNVTPELWGSGYATEIARAVALFAFDVRGIHRLEATCHPDNVASARVLEKAGLTFEGRLRDHARKDGRWRDSLLYAVIAPT